MAFDYDTTNQAASPVVVPANPNVEGTNSGVNGASCNPGIGIASAVAQPKAQDWPRVAINPARGQALGWGGDSVVTGQLTANIPALKSADYGAADFNNTFSFVQATSAVSAKGAAPAVGFILASDLDRTVQIGEWVWATAAVA